MERPHGAADRIVAAATAATAATAARDHVTDHTPL
jgi:hypothetical protein